MSDTRVLWLDFCFTFVKWMCLILLLIVISMVKDKSYMRVNNKIFFKYYYNSNMCNLWIILIATRGRQRMTCGLGQPGLDFWQVKCMNSAYDKHSDDLNEDGKWKDSKQTQLERSHFSNFYYISYQCGSAQNCIASNCFKCIILNLLNLNLYPI